MLPDFYLIHALDQAPPGCWLVVPPFDKVSLDIDDADLGRATLGALARSGPIREYQPSRAPADGELISHRFPVSEAVCEFCHHLYGIQRRIRLVDCPS
jgi:hypothetical protein